MRNQKCSTDMHFVQWQLNAKAKDFKKYIYIFYSVSEWRICKSWFTHYKGPVIRRICYALGYFWPSMGLLSLNKAWNINNFTFKFFSNIIERNKCNLIFLLVSDRTYLTMDNGSTRVQYNAMLLSFFSTNYLCTCPFEFQSIRRNEIFSFSAHVMTLIILCMKCNQ